MNSKTLEKRANEVTEIFKSRSCDFEVKIEEDNIWKGSYVLCIWFESNSYQYFNRWDVERLLKLGYFYWTVIYKNIWSKDNSNPYHLVIEIRLKKVNKKKTHKKHKTQTPTLKAEDKWGN